jgi:hypothetical protein
MATVKLSYEKGTAYTQREIRETAKRIGVQARFVHSCYVGHFGLEAFGGVRKLKAFLGEVGLTWGITFIER